MSLNPVLLALSRAMRLAQCWAIVPWEKWSQPHSCKAETRSGDLACIWLFWCPWGRNSVFTSQADRLTASHMWRYKMDTQNSAPIWAQKWLFRQSLLIFIQRVDFSIIFLSILMKSCSWSETVLFAAVHLKWLQSLIPLQGHDAVFSHMVCSIPFSFPWHCHDSFCWYNHSHISN